MSYLVRDLQGKDLFRIDVDKPYEGGIKFGFNFDNAPNVYALFRVERVEEDILYVSGPMRVLK